MSRGRARSGRGAQRPASAFERTPTMTKDQKIIRAKVGVLELARQLGNVSQACKRACHIRRPCCAPLGVVADAMPLLSYSGYRFPRDIIQRAVWMYLRLH